jgi:hypothetical protein
LNNNATYWDSAFEDLLVDDRDMTNQAELRMSEVNRQSFGWFDVDRVNGLISGSLYSPTNNILNSNNSLSFPIVPIIDDGEEEQKNDNEKNNSEIKTVTLTFLQSLILENLTNDIL